MTEKQALIADILAKVETWPSAYQAKFLVILELLLSIQ